MSEENIEKVDQAKAANADASNSVKLQGLYAFKLGMSSVYDEDGKAIPVTVLQFKPCVISQVKTQATDGYAAVQIAIEPKKAVRTTKAESQHLAKSGFENGAYFIKEIRQDVSDEVVVGKSVSIESFAKGDIVKMTGTSKGRGFSGVVKRHGFGGGPAAHGSGFHRRPGSIGNREFPGRVMPGRKLPGRFGHEVNTVKNVEIVDVISEENVLLIKGPVPGARNSIVKLMKI